MVSNLILDTAQVAGIAAQIRQLNRELEEVLNSTQSKMNSLSSSWTGAAADAAIGSYNSFAQNYFQEYKSLIDDYAKFLETNVSEDYTAIEKGNVAAAEALK